MASNEPRAREIAGNIQQGVSHRLRSVWWAMLLRGILALALAACALFWPQRTMDLLVKLLGIYFLLDGLWSAISAWRSRNLTAMPLQAVVSIVAGLVLLFWTDIGTNVFMIVAGVWALLQGLGVIMSSRELESDDADRTLMAIIGAVIGVVGLVFILWPDKGVTTISWLIGIGALVVGLLLVYLATRLRRVRRRVEGMGQGG